jgi:hypothetical protein
MSPILEYEIDARAHISPKKTIRGRDECNTERFSSSSTASPALLMRMIVCPKTVIELMGPILADRKNKEVFPFPMDTVYLLTIELLMLEPMQPFCAPLGREVAQVPHKRLPLRPGWKGGLLSLREEVSINDRGPREDQSRCDNGS